MNAPAKTSAKSQWAPLLKDRLLAHSPDLPASADVASVQELFEHPLPSVWISWVSECGFLTGYGRALLGLRPRTPRTVGESREDALDILTLLRLTEPGFASDLLPLEVLPERQLHCIVVDNVCCGRVVMVDIDRPLVQVDTGTSLKDFLYEWRADLHAISAVVEDVQGRPEGEAVLLRPDEWSTRRLCSQNVIVALLQTRHNRDTNEHDVAVFATASLTAFAPGAPVRWALTTILTEAHQAGGSLAANFVRRVRERGKLDPQRVQREGQRIPPAIVRWARSHGVPLDSRQTRWEHETGEQLFIAATRLPASLRELLPQVSVPAPTVCAAITTGTWPSLDVEIVLRWAADPVRILTGSVVPADRLRYLADQQVLRTAIMLSSLLRHLQRADQPSASDEDDTSRTITVRVAGHPTDLADLALSAVTYASDDGTPVTAGWPVLAGRHSAASDLTVHVLAVDADLLAELGPTVVRALHVGAVLIVPADAASRAHQLGAFLAAAEDAGACVFAAPDYTTSMDVAIAARLDRARMSRQ